MRTKQKAYKKNKKILFIVSVSVIVLFLTVFFASRGTLASLEGWGAGIWNDLNIISGVPTDTGTPTIGWLSSNSELSGCGGALSKKYSVNFGEPDKVSGDRPIYGSAWFGIGSKPDSGGVCDSPKDLPSVGWLNFSAGSPYFCPVTDTDCHPAMWHPNTSDPDSKEGYLDGWANITSMGNSGWVRLKDPSGTHYAVVSNALGILSGYSWNSGTESTIPGNSGLGWIKMDGLKVGDCKLGCATKQVCRGETIPGSSCDSSFCSGDSTSCALGSGNLSWTCSNSCGDVSCAPSIVDPVVGVCGSLNGKYACDDSPEPDKLCSDGAAYNDNFDRSDGVTATWTCGNICGTEVTCSASARCGWVETN